MPNSQLFVPILKQIQSKHLSNFHNVLFWWFRHALCFLCLLQTTCSNFSVPRSLLKSKYLFSSCGHNTSPAFTNFLPGGNFSSPHTSLSCQGCFKLASVLVGRSNTNLTTPIAKDVKENNLESLDELRVKGQRWVWLTKLWESMHGFPN